MKKIININLSGRVIPIEDSAYEKLQAYIESLRRYFSNEDGREEIINDIESRLAELMNEKVRKGAAAVTDTDVDEIIKSMGRPEEFDADTTDTADTSSSKQQYQQNYTREERKARGRLYRDSSDKFIGGVCSGIAAYLNTDPAIVRILFAIITFGGLGVGFLLYILLWIILPTKDLEGYSGKRLYRNPGDRVIGGVGGGLAAYFDKETWMIRLIFVAPFILSAFFGLVGGNHWDFDFFPNIFFSSLTGTFLFVYVILWMVLPEARSSYEKMEMRGEKVDVNSIRQNVKEGMGTMKDRMKDWGDEVKESAQNFGTKAKEFANTRGKTFASEFGDTARRSSTGIGHAIGVLFKVFFLFIAGTIAFSLFIALLAIVFSGFAWWPLTNFLWTSKWQEVYAWGTILFFLVVPLVGFIIWLIRRIVGIKSRRSYLGWTFSFLWALGWVSVVLFAASISKDFREFQHLDTPLEISQPAHGRMIVAVSQPELEYTGNFGWINDGIQGWDVKQDTIRLSTVKINIEKSIDSSYHVVLKRHSFGRTEGEALNRAERIQYTVTSMDSVLDLANGYTVDKQSKFRGQQMEIEIQVPVGKKIRFDQSVRNKLNPTDFRIKRNYRNSNGNYSRYEENRPFPFESNIDYTMTREGFLKGTDGVNFNTSSSVGYRYEDKSDSTILKEQIEEEKRKKEESERRIKELEEEQKKVKPTGATEKMDDGDDDATTDNSSPISSFSLVKWF